MDGDSFKNAGRRQLIKTAWEEGWSTSPDPIVAWELAWGKVRELFKAFRQEDRSKLSELRKKQGLLQELRGRISQHSSEEELHEYKSLEKGVHETELLEASVLRRRSRVKWVSEGDACSRYFFQCLKTKQDQERIIALEDDEDGRIEDEEIILKKVHSFYQQLYSQQKVSTEDKEWDIPASTSLFQLKIMLKQYCRTYSPNEQILFPLLKKLQASVLLHLQSNGRWKDIRIELEAAGHILNPSQLQEIRNFQAWLYRVKTDTRTLQESPSWRWSGATTPWKGWNNKSKFWADLLSKEEEAEDLSHKWIQGGRSPSRIDSWSNRWRQLWRSTATSRSKLWIWRVLKHGFWTGERAAKIGVSSADCRRCGFQLETVDHMFWGCSMVSSTWAELKERAHARRVSFKIQPTLIDTLDEAITSNKRGGTLLQIMAELFQQIWKDRNSKVFRDVNSSTPLNVVLTKARHEWEASIKIKCNQSKWERGLYGLQEMNILIGDNPTRVSRQDIHIPTNDGHSALEQTRSHEDEGTESPRPEREENSALYRADPRTDTSASLESLSHSISRRLTLRCDHMRGRQVPSLSPFLRAPRSSQHNTEEQDVWTTED
ncbi:hypothetical protein R1sor_018234 [Riccia sorocarpa]|uniref:Reverse transcriptase zinc-binding domain-containing protein n=1 Tax=Riccia sorocarpa TaxID=122646 RepID=A0ABD3ID69_9MARC